MPEDTNVTTGAEQVDAAGQQETLAESTETNQTTQTGEGTSAADSRVEQAFARRLASERQKIEQEYSPYRGLIEAEAKRNNMTPEQYIQAVNDQRAAEERQQFQEQNGFNPDAVKPLFEQWKQTDPDFQELSKLRTEANVNKALSDFNSEYKDLNLNSLEDVFKLPNSESIVGYVQRGLSLNDAYKLANYNDLVSKQATTIEQDTIKKLNQNSTSSPGALSLGADSQTNSISKMSKTDFAKLQQEVLRGERKTL